VTASDLPTLNAILNTLATGLLLAGLIQIKRGNIDVHRRFMIAAFVVSGLFLVSYVVYHVQVGSVPYRGTGLWRVAYFTILIPHVVLAAAVLPLALVTLRRGLARNDAAHRALARLTLPVWLFVSVTGVVVYLMLYQMHWP
jgi:putative membrane protein